MTTPFWNRAVLSPRRRIVRRVVKVTVIAAAVGGAVAIAMTTLDLERTANLVPVITPAPVVQVNVPPQSAPDPWDTPPRKGPLKIEIVAQPAPPEPPAPVVPEPPPEPKPRAARPRLDTKCLLSVDVDMDETCQWDDGFPAISGAGATIAVKQTSAAPGGNILSSIGFLDVRTSHVTPWALLTIEDNYDGDTDDDYSRLRPKLAARGAAVQRKLDAEGFRPLVDLGPDAIQPPNSLRAEAPGDGASVRIVDPASMTVIWQHRFPAPTSIEESEECDGSSSTHVWWDARTRQVLIERTIAIKECKTETVYSVHRVP